MLPDREAETVARWLADHPGVEIITRDRAGAYADGARKGAPHARQIADRFHLLVNLQNAFARLFERKHELLNAVLAAEQAQNTDRDSPSLQHNEEGKSEPKPLTPTEAQRQASHARRKKRYDEVIKLHEQGLSQTAIATMVGLHRDTVYGQPAWHQAYQQRKQQLARGVPTKPLSPRGAPGSLFAIHASSKRSAREWDS